MSHNSRSQGLGLLVLGGLVFVGTTNQMLPAVAFWPALAACCIGIFVFMKANRVATEEAEKRTKQALDPKIRNRTLERFAEKQSQLDGHVLGALDEREARKLAAQSTESIQLAEDEIVLYEVDEPNAEAGNEDFVVTTDVSFPLEIQEQTSLADQLQKLQRLHEDGIISADEFAVAKAKLLK